MTREDVLKAFAEVDAKIAKKIAEQQPKPAQVKLEERCAEKPTEAVIRDAAIHNEAATERLRQERMQARQREELAEAAQARYQAVLDRHWQSMLDAQREHRSRMVGGFLEGGAGDYSPIERYERVTLGARLRETHQCRSQLPST
jgi:hypothetical protein